MHVAHELHYKGKGYEVVLKIEDTKNNKRLTKYKA